MNKKQWYVMMIATFSLGYILGKRIKQNQRIKPEEVLTDIRQSFKEKYEVSGSWIYMKPEYIHKNDLVYEVYHGGITKSVKDKDIPYEFYADTYTGTIVEMHPTSTSTFR